MSRWARIRAALTPAEWRRAALLAAVILGLHAVGFFILLALVVPNDYSLAGGGVFGLGVGITAYTLGLRHAFDADHIAAIDNTTRKLMAEGQRPLSVGFFFSLGHSTIVFALGVLVVFGVRGLSGALESDGSALHQATGLIGPGDLRRLPAPDRAAEPGDPAQRRADLPRPAARASSTRRSSSAQLGVARAHEPRVRARDAGDPQAVAHVSARAACSGSASTPRPRSACSSWPAARRRAACRSTRSSACRSCSRPACRCSTRSTARS